MRNLLLVPLSAILCAACAGSELTRKPPALAGMEEPLERMQPPDDEAARLALPQGSFTGLVAGDARASLDAMLGEPQGVLVVSVVENSPADAAGIEAGDLVLEARTNETLVLYWPSEWRALELETKAGTTLRLVLDRAGAERECELTTIARVRAAERGASERIREEERVGVVLRTATEVEARAAGLGPGGGAVVVGLTRESPWREAGIVFGDLIRALDGVAVADPAMVVERIRSAPEDGTLELEIVRAGARLKLSARASARAHEWNEIWIPLLFHYEKERDQSSTSALLGLYRYVSTPAAWRLRLLWFLRFSGGDADRLESLPR
ncbi:MAG: PDZ domain-containing protein [Planctomycetes bacterium]|nr:PDZ domain-containing protein [Planctomycetota bacterium]